MELINFKEKEMMPLTHQQQLNYEESKYCHICKKKFYEDEDDNHKSKSYNKVRDHCHYTGTYRGVAHSICNLRYKIQWEIPVVLHDGSTYDYHFIIKELAKQFKGNMECSGENMEKYITFKVLPKKINKNGKPIIYNVKFIDSFRFMATSLSSFTDNLSEINKKEWKSCKEREKISINCTFIKLENNRFIYKCKKCNDISYKSVDALKEKFLNTYRFCNKDINKFILLLRKGVYPYEYMDSWERFNETSLPPKESFYSELNLEDISDKDYLHAQKVWDVFEIKELGEYHDLYVQSDTLLLADIFEKCRNTCIEIYELDPAHFLSAPGLAWQACLKKNKCKFRITNRLWYVINDWIRN